MIIDAKTGRVIAKKQVFCTTLFSKGTGLMFRTRYAVKDTGWIFSFSKPATTAITMWFVFYPLDIIFLDSKKRVVEIVVGLRPFTNYLPRKRARYFIEFTAGTVKRKNICLGQTMRFSQ